MQRIWQSFLSLFKYHASVYWPLVAMFCAINLIVLLNTVFHNPFIGYDSAGHIDYVNTLSQGHLPEKETNIEFFSPPLPYVIPAIFKAIGFELSNAARIELFINFFASLGITTLFLKIIRRLARDRPEIQTLGLLIFGMIPVYYKTLSFLRGEPLVTFFTLLIIDLSVKIFIDKDFRRSNLIFLGISLGLGILSRQWAFFIFPALIMLAGIKVIYVKEIRKNVIQALLVSIVTAFIVGGWFYIGLLQRYGTVTAFNRSPGDSKSLSLSIFSSFDTKMLFTDPIRPAYSNKFWPIMYSETWGDYWGYFSIFAFRPKTGYFLNGRDMESINPKADLQYLITNRFTFNHYLAQVNLISLFPSLLLIIGLFFGVYSLIKLCLGQSEQLSEYEGFLGLIVFFTIAGYTWFLIQYPSPNKGDTIKASYILNIFPLFALLVASFLQRLPESCKWCLWTITYILAFIMLYSSRAMVSNYIYFPW